MEDKMYIVNSSGQVEKVSYNPCVVVLSQKGEPTGLLIKDVVSGSAADHAGLRVDDVISQIDGMPVTFYEHSYRRCFSESIGPAEIRLRVVRGPETTDIVVTPAILDGRHQLGIGYHIRVPALYFGPEVSLDQPYLLLEHLEHLQILRLMFVNTEIPRRQKLDLVFEPDESDKESMLIEFDVCKEDDTVFDRRVNRSDLFAEILAKFERGDLVMATVCSS